MLNRRGMFSISRKVIKANPLLVMNEVMSRCVIVRAEMLWEQDVIQYVALSPYFDEISDMEISPIYDVEIIGSKAQFVRRAT